MKTPLSSTNAEVAQVLPAIEELLEKVRGALTRGDKTWLRLNVQCDKHYVAVVHTIEDRTFQLDGRPKGDINSR